MRAVLFLVLGLVLVAEAADILDPRTSIAMSERRISGYTRPFATLDIAPEVGGRLLAVLPQVGERIAAEAGPVVRLDPVLADLSIVEAEAHHAAATAGIAMREAEGERAARDLELATREAERQTTLGVAGSASVRDNAHTNKARAETAIAATRAALAVATADLAAAKVRLAGAKERRLRQDVSAPVGWVVVERLLEPGAMCNAGQPVLRLVDVRQLIVPLRVDESEIAALRVHPTIQMTLNGSQVINATLRRIDVTYDPSSRKRLAELMLNGSLVTEASGGLPVELTLLVAESNLVNIPSAYVSWRLEQPWVRPVTGPEVPLDHLRRTEDGGIVVPLSRLPADLRLLTFAN